MAAIFAIVVMVILSGAFGPGDKEVERDYSVDRAHVIQNEDGNKW